MDVKRASGTPATSSEVLAITLAHDERRLRRRVLNVDGTTKVLVDFPSPTTLEDGDQLVLEDGRTVRVSAAVEALHDIRAKSPTHLSELAWHIGNRHLAAAIEADRILILRDHVIGAMLEGLGAEVRESDEAFRPMRGAYGGHSHGGDGKSGASEPLGKEHSH
ncbi:MAG: urease accessory protein UreE [Pseudomonadota bacterium]